MTPEQKRTLWMMTEEYRQKRKEKNEKLYNRLKEDKMKGRR